MLTVRSFANVPVTSNCYVLFDEDLSNDCLIIDPGSRSEDELTEYLTEEGLIPRFIILTHEHFDHCWGVNQLTKRYPVPVICSQSCADAIKNEKRNCSVFYDNGEGFMIDCETVSTESIDSVLQFGKHEIRFFKTPGHTDASISLVAGQYLFTGDTLISEECTVTKLPTGSASKLKESLSLYTEMQGREYCVFPGHGKEFNLDGYELSKMIKKETSK